MFRLDIWKKTFYIKGGEALEQTVQRDGGSPVLETSKVSLDWALSNLIEL